MAGYEHKELYLLSSIATSTRNKPKQDTTVPSIWKTARVFSPLYDNGRRRESALFAVINIRPILLSLSLHLLREKMANAALEEDSFQGKGEREKSWFGNA